MARSVSPASSSFTAGSCSLRRCASAGATSVFRHTIAMGRSPSRSPAPRCTSLPAGARGTWSAPSHAARAARRSTHGRYELLLLRAPAVAAAVAAAAAAAASA
eukprot:CAMPEP_0202098142 /NCGR_PEP_ID=MMETSP0965-20130614/1595_1 /ASSEMBLY_ACC=CAM_ASM_000507 /TAXON_ID=4773 /ORGANISM="Schizochytrium aggregatum, Strain ATCC28209" /LENGTH=102 /DNA_ID=CAMNT_0048666545 /DNA_START=486 /DNA_END=790 /DNA_ORIENTATION=+